MPASNDKLHKMRKRARMGGPFPQPPPLPPTVGYRKPHRKMAPPPVPQQLCAPYNTIIKRFCRPAVIRPVRKFWIKRTNYNFPPGSLLDIPPSTHPQTPLQQLKPKPTIVPKYRRMAAGDRNPLALPVGEIRMRWPTWSIRQAAAHTQTPPNPYRPHSTVTSDVYRPRPDAECGASRSTVPAADTYRPRVDEAQ